MSDQKSPPVVETEAEALLREAFYHLHTLILVEEANYTLPQSKGLKETYLQIKNLLKL